MKFTTIPPKMKVFGVKEYKSMGDVSALQEYEVPTPVNIEKGHDLLVEVKAVATNPIDYKKLGNLGNAMTTDEELVLIDPPLVVGWDTAGVVVAVGSDVTMFKVGDEVMFAGDLFRAGSFGQYTLVDERIVGSKPNNLTWSQAASLPLTGLTAWETMVDQLKIPIPAASDLDNNNNTNSNKTILITGGGGGVSTAAIQIAKHVLKIGTVIATGSRPESVEYVKQLGADYVINHHESLTEQIQDLKLIDGKKANGNVDYVFHTVDLTPELWTEFIALTKPFGGIVSIWPSASVNLMDLFWKSINFSAVLMFTRPPLTDDPSNQIIRQHEILQNISKLVEDGVLSSREKTTSKLTLDNLKSALTLQASGKAIGKITLSF